MLRGAVSRPAADSTLLSERKVFFCQVLGAARQHGGDPAGALGLEPAAIGERVKLVHDPQNKLDPNALLVLRLDGQPVGFISGRQAARFPNDLDLLTANLHSWEKDDGDNDVLKLRVEAPVERQAHEVLPPPPVPEDPSAAARPVPAAQKPANISPGKDYWNFDILKLRVVDCSEPPGREASPAGPAQAAQLAPSLRQRLEALSIWEVLLGTVAITVTGVALSYHDWGVAATAAAIALLYTLLRSRQ